MALSWNNSILLQEEPASRNLATEVGVCNVLTQCTHD